MNNGAFFDTPGVPGGGSIVEMQEFKIFFVYLLTVALPRRFFTFIKLKPDVTLIYLLGIESDHITFQSHND